MKYQEYKISCGRRDTLTELIQYMKQIEPLLKEDRKLYKIVLWGEYKFENRYIKFKYVLKPIRTKHNIKHIRNAIRSRSNQL